MMKRLAAIAAMSLVAFQAVSGVAVGATAHLGSSTAPLISAKGSDCPEAAVLGVYNISIDEDLTLGIDGDELTCNPDKGGQSDVVSLTDVDKVIVYGYDSSEGHGHNNDPVSVTFDLADGTDLADFGGIEFSVKVEGNVNIDGSGVTDDRDDFDVDLEDDAFSVSDADLDVTVLYAKSYYVELGAGDDTVDGKKVTAVGFEADAGDGKDVIYGGTGDDTLNCDADGADSGLDQCWGGDGDDDIYSDGDVVAPGAGDDNIDGAVYLASYGDSKSAVVIAVGACGEDSEVESAAGDDDFDEPVGSWVGTSKGDKFFGSNADDGTDCGTPYLGKDSFSGGAGDDFARGGSGSDTFRGGTGDDVLKGGAGMDKLRGDAGSDEAWGGRGKDACGAEVTDSCEFLKG